MSSYPVSNTNGTRYRSLDAMMHSPQEGQSSSLYDRRAPDQYLAGHQPLHQGAPLYRAAMTLEASNRVTENLTRPTLNTNTDYLCEHPYSAERHDTLQTSAIIPTSPDMNNAVTQLA